MYWYVSDRPVPEQGTVEQDTTEMTWDELAATVPQLTTVRGENSTEEVCQDVPTELLFPQRPPPDTVYRNLFTANSARPAVDYGERVGLAPLARSSKPFLYLGLKKGGVPTIEHDGQSTTVRTYGPSGRGYEFRYDYHPPRFELFAEVYGRGQWWPPTVPVLGRTSLTAGLDLGARYGRGRMQAGIAYSSRIGPAVRIKGAWRFASWSP